MNVHRGPMTEVQRPAPLRATTCALCGKAATSADHRCPNGVTRCLCCAERLSPIEVARSSQLHRTHGRFGKCAAYAECRRSAGLLPHTWVRTPRCPETVRARRDAERARTAVGSF